MYTLKRVCLSHTGQINTIESSIDESKVFTGSDDNTIKIWSSSSGDLLKTLKGHILPVSKLSVDPENRWIHSVSFDGTLKTWDLQRSKNISTGKGHRSMISDLICDSSLIFTSSQQSEVNLWKCLDTRPFHKIITKSPVNSMILKENHLFCAMKNGLIDQIDLRNSEKVVQSFNFRQEIIKIENFESEIFVSTGNFIENLNNSLQIQNQFFIEDFTKIGSEFIFCDKNGIFSQIYDTQKLEKSDISVPGQESLKGAKSLKITEKWLISGHFDHSLRFWQQSNLS